MPTSNIVNMPAHWSTDPPNEWNDAHLAYDSGKFDDALHSLQDHPREEPNYYYNLGTVHFKLGHPGLAVAYLEKANRMRAHDTDIQNNLATARNELGRVIGEARLDTSSTWVESLADRVPLDEVRGTLGLVAFVLTLVWTRKYWITRDIKKTLLQPAGILTLVALFITSALYFAQRSADSHPPAVALDSQTIRSGPGNTFIDLGHVEAGVKLRLLGPTALEGTETWRQVRFSGDGIGWIPSSSLLLL